jgi:hypothetical protein
VRRFVGTPDPATGVLPGLTRKNGGDAMVLTARLLLGIKYSMQSPVGSDGDGHDWIPGDPWPDALDCSGLVVVVCRRVGLFSISNENADLQWLQHLGGRIHPSKPLEPGDIGSFMGIENIPGYVGHTGIVTEYNTHTKVGTLLSAYTTEDGVCEIPFDRNQTTNEENGLGVVGFYRPAARFSE